ncbi:MAG: glycosyltransferase family 25 protein [Verrucomicrobia bacterium]|nr:glycosyltransferase family 25 protein [Verrucomicrobiota bacterium]
MNSVRGIDFIYTINLDERPEKFAHCVNELAPYSIEPYRFSAVNGWKLSLDLIDDVGVRYDPTTMQGGLWATSFSPEYHHSIIDQPGKIYFGHCISRGVIGILLSHLSILQDAYDSGYSTIWVMEDDVQVLKNPHILSSLIDELDSTVGPGKWDILFTDKDTKDQEGNYVECRGYAPRPNYTPKNPIRFSERESIGSFIKTGARYGAYSMIIRRSGMEKILHYFKKHNLFLPYDMEFYIPSNIQMYTVSEDVVSTLPRALSDNGAPNFLNK